MRTSLLAAALILFSVACADAPITAADLQADGQLRPGSQQSVLAANNLAEPQRAERLAVTGVLANQAEGPIEDATRFATGEGIYLYLRADDLSQPRPVTYVWTHGETKRETMGFLHPAETLSVAASLPLAQPLVEMDPDLAATFDPRDHAGSWRIEVYSVEGSDRSLVFERDFEVIEADAFAAEALAAETLAHEPHRAI